MNAMSKSKSMQGFAMSALNYINETIMRGSDWIIDFKLDHYSKRELDETGEAAVVIAHVVWCSGVNNSLWSCGTGTSNSS